MNALSLCSGIGALDLGLERAGMRAVGFVEKDDYCRMVLAKHWPHIPQHDDVKTAAEWWQSEERPRVDVVSAGYPCQPFSTAGKMLGAEDERHLWPFVAAALRVLRPRYAVLENVSAHLRLGLDRVLGDLAELGFDAEWSVVQAGALGAPHRRPRVFVLAYSNVTELGGRGRVPTLEASERDRDQLADAHRCRAHLSGPTDAEPWAREPGVGRMVDGDATDLDRYRLYALGNAVVPQVAEYIGRRLIAFDQEVAA